MRISNIIKKSTVAFVTIFNLVNHLHSQNNFTTQPANQSLCGNVTASFEIDHKYTQTDIQAETWQVKRGVSSSKWLEISNSSVYLNTKSKKLTIQNSPDSINGYYFRYFIKLKTGTNDSSNPATLTINVVPTEPAVSTINQIACKNSTSITLSATASSNCTLLWYTSSVGGNSSASNPTIQTTSVGVYKNYVAQKNTTTNCESTRKELTTEIKELPSKPQLASANVEYCKGGTAAQLSATKSNGCTLYWYSTLNATSGNTTAPTPSTNSVGSTDYFVGQTDDNTKCESEKVKIVVLVEALPEVISSPSDKTVCEDGSVDFSVTAAGAGIKYEWEVNQGSGYIKINSAGSGPIYADFDKSTLKISSIPSSANNFLYRCRVIGKCTPDAVSVPSKLIVNIKPKIQSNSSDIIVCETGNTSLKISAVGTSLSYQWQVNYGSGFSDITSPGNNPKFEDYKTNQLKVGSAVSSINGAIFRCVVSGACSPTVTSAESKITVKILPQITSQINKVNSCEGKEVELQVSAIGSDLKYQWQENSGMGWSDLNANGSNPTYNNQQSNKLALGKLVYWNSGFKYRCIVQGYCLPNDTSNDIELNVGIQPIITSNGKNVSKCKFEDADLMVQATGSDLKYEWFFKNGSNWTKIDSINANGIYKNYFTNNLDLFNLTNSNSYKCRISNVGCSPKESQILEVRVNELPFIKIGKDTEICVGQFLSLNADIPQNTKKITWTPATAINKVSSKNVIVNPIQTTIYEMRVSDSNNCENKNQIKITVQPKPIYSLNRENGTICSTEKDTLKISTVDNINWKSNFNITNIGNGMFELNSPNNQIYKFNLTTIYGCTDSFNYNLKINQIPNIDAGPSTSICRGNNIQLNASGGKYYKWKKDPYLSFENSNNPTAFPIFNKVFYVTGTDENGCESSDSIKITVNDNPEIRLLSDSAVCYGEKLDLNMFDNKYSYKWKPSFQLSNLNLKSPKFTGTYSEILQLEVTNEFGCTKSGFISIKVNPLPSADINGTNTTYCKNSILKAVVSDGVNWNWYYNGLMIDQAKSIEKKITQSGSLKVEVISNQNCKSTDSMLIEVLDNPTPIITGDSLFCQNQRYAYFGSGHNSSGNTFKWEVEGGEIVKGEFSRDVYVNWDKNNMGKIKLTEFMSVAPFCSTSVSKNILLNKGIAPNPTIIKPKGGSILSNILIADNKDYEYYLWGKERKSDSQREYTCSNKTWCSFEEIDTFGFNYFLLAGDDSVCPNISYFNTTKILSTSAVKNSKFRIYPNPATDLITLDVQNLGPLKSVKIFNQNGKILGEYKNNLQINVDYLNRGVYYIMIENVDGPLLVEKLFLQ
jgi:hypothetical protein